MNVDGERTSTDDDTQSHVCVRERVSCVDRQAAPPSPSFVYSHKQHTHWPMCLYRNSFNTNARIHRVSVCRRRRVSNSDHFTANDHSFECLFVSIGNEDAVNCASCRPFSVTSLSLTHHSTNERNAMSSSPPPTQAQAAAAERERDARQVSVDSVRPLNAGESAFVRPLRMRYTLDDQRQRVWDCVRVHDSVAIVL